MTKKTAGFHNHPIHSCRYNERYLLHLLRLRQRDSKANLARATGLTAAAVGGLIGSLQKKGLVDVVGKVQGDMGQPATLYSLCSSGAYGIGVSLNRGHIETVLINFAGDVVERKRHLCILPSPEDALDIVHADIVKIIDSIGVEDSKRIAGIGVAQPYNIGSWKHENNDWEAWDSFDIAEELSKLTSYESYMQNDANAAAIAELVYGAAQDKTDFVYLFLGSAMVLSMGGAVVLQGECRKGFTGNAGDLGLIPVPAGKIQTNRSSGSDLLDSGCGSDHTLLTQRCSLYSLVKYLRSVGATITNRAQFDKAIQEYRPEVEYWIDDCADGLKKAIIGLQAILDIPSVILDCEDEDASLVNEIKTVLDNHLVKSPTPGMAMPQLRRGSFGSNGAAIGAATLPMDWCFSPPSQ